MKIKPRFMEGKQRAGKQNIDHHGSDFDESEETFHGGPIIPYLMTGEDGTVPFKVLALLVGNKGI